MTTELTRLEPASSASLDPSTRGSLGPRSLLARALLLLIRAYQLSLSRLQGDVCRFHPSCSRYTATCIELHGALRGSLLGLRRIGRCHPFHPGGFDPPPLPKPRSRR